MPVSITKTLLIIGVCALCTYMERLLPFLLFRKGNPPQWVRYLGKVLPAAIMATLVIYCLRETNFTALSTVLPQLVGVAVTALLHLWKHNTLLSVLCGTAVYMCFVQFICI